MENPNANQSCKEEAKRNDEEANPPPPLGHSCLHLSRLCPPLYRARLLHMLEMLAWKTTSPSSMPCQPTVLMRGKT
jgi:hypothetical protein